MPIASPPSRDVAIETRVFWMRFRNEIAAVLVIALLAIIGFGAFRFYSERRDAAASAMLGDAKNPQDYQQVIARYSETPASADAALLLAAALRSEKKFAEANVTLQNFLNKNPEHSLVTTARMAIAANLESMGKSDEALAVYQQVASMYPKSFNAPLALISQVHLLKAKNKADEARQVCEMILTQYRDSFWAREAAQELHTLKPSIALTSPPASAGNRSAPPPLLMRPSAAQPAAAPTAQPK